MKKGIVGLILFVLCLFAFAPAALAEDIKINVTAVPMELSEAGDVVFSFEISNNSVYELHDLTITYNQAVYDVMKLRNMAPIAPGSAVSIPLSLRVGDSQLGRPIVFTVGWRQGGEPFTRDVEITIARTANPEITVTRTVSAQMAKQGETITIIYDLSNDTGYDMTNIVLIDENISDTQLLRLDVLKAHSSYTFRQPYRMGTDDVVSAPVVNYEVNGKFKVHRSTLPMTLAMVLIQLDLKVDAGVPSSAGVTFTLEIKNAGNQMIQDIRIVDERGTPVNSSLFSLAAGETVTYPFLIVPEMTEPVRYVSFRLSGTDPFGEPYTLESAVNYEVYPFVDDSQISVTMRAETVVPWTQESGIVTARIVVTNYSVVGLTNIIFYESTIGVVKTATVLPSGESTYDIELLIGTPRNLQFFMKASDPTGTVRELGMCLLPVAYSDGEHAELATPKPDQTTGVAFAALTAAITKILMALGVLMVLAFVALVVLSLTDRANRDFLRFEDDKTGDDDLDSLFASEANDDFNPGYDVDYFTKRIEKAELRQQQAQPDPEPLRLPEPAPLIEDVFPPEDLERLIASALPSTRNSGQEDSVSLRQEAQTDERGSEGDLPMPDQLHTPKVVSVRPNPGARPTSRGHIHYVRSDAEKTDG